MDLDIDHPNPAADIANLIEQGRRVDSAASVKEMMEKIPTARNVVLAAVFRCLGARKWFFEKGAEERTFEPDYRTQLDAAKLLMAYMDGLPTQTTLNVNVGDKPNGEPELDLESAVAKSPALRERLAKMLAKAEKLAIPA